MSSFFHGLVLESQTSFLGAWNDDNPSVFVMFNGDIHRKSMYNLPWILAKRKCKFLFKTHPFHTPSETSEGLDLVIRIFQPKLYQDEPSNSAWSVWKGGRIMPFKEELHVCRKGSNPWIPNQSHQMAPPLGSSIGPTWYILLRSELHHLLWLGPANPGSNSAKNGHKIKYPIHWSSYFA